MVEKEGWKRRSKKKEATGGWTAGGMELGLERVAIECLALTRWPEAKVRVTEEQPLRSHIHRSGAGSRVEGSHLREYIGSIDIDMHYTRFLFQQIQRKPKLTGQFSLPEVPDELVR